jgi:hypothetical protein|nr:MAG TPA: hypothetical protein [Caudoviricetes sp.]
MKKYTQKDYINNNIDLSNIKTFDDFVVATVEGYVKNGHRVDKWMFEQYKSIIKFNSIREFLNDAFKLGNTIYKSKDGITIEQAELTIINKDNDEAMSEGESCDAPVKKESFLKRMFNIFKRK